MTRRLANGRIRALAGLARRARVMAAAVGVAVAGAARLGGPAARASGSAALRSAPRSVASLPLLLLLALALLPALAPVRAATPEPSAVELREALLLEDGQERPVMLPDPWEASAPRRHGTVRYRLALPDAALRWPPSAVFIPRAGNAYSLSLNGQTLLSAGDVRRGEAEASRSPLLLPLPAAALRERGNVLDLELSGEPWREPGLSTVWVGPMDELLPRYARLRDHQVRGAWLVSAAAGVMGALALLLAWRARRFVYACFGAASLLWAWRMSGMQLEFGGPGTRLGTVLFHASYAWFAVLMALYALAAVGRDSARVRAVLGVWALVSLGLAAGLVAFEAPLLRGLLLVGTLGLAAWLLAVLLVTAWRQRSSAALLLALATLASGAVGARDLWVFRVLHDYGALTWSRYTILLLLAVLAWLLVDEFARSGAALRALNRELLDRVAGKERELQCAFEATRERERAQAVLAERDRILREMHDGLGGRLVAALALTSQLARQAAVPAAAAPAPERAPGEAPGDGPDAAPAPTSRPSLDEPLRELKMTLDDCLIELRLALDSLETEQRSLVESLGELRFRVEPSLRAAGVRLVWQVADAASELELPASETLHVLRIVREALTNVIKHAHASVAWLRLEARPDGALVLAVVDNGLQQRAADEQSPLPLFVPPTVVHGGRGLANMQRRARTLGGALESGPHPEGWAVTLTLPGAAAGAAAPAVAAAHVTAPTAAAADGSGVPQAPATSVASARMDAPPPSVEAAPPPAEAIAAPADPLASPPAGAATTPEPGAGADAPAASPGRPATAS